MALFSSVEQKILDYLVSSGAATPQQLADRLGVENLSNSAPRPPPQLTGTKPTTQTTTAPQTTSSGKYSPAELTILDYMVSTGAATPEQLADRLGGENLGNWGAYQAALSGLNVSPVGLPLDTFEQQFRNDRIMGGNVERGVPQDANPGGIGIPQAFNNPLQGMSQNWMPSYGPETPWSFSNFRQGPAQAPEIPLPQNAGSLNGGPMFQQAAQMAGPAAFSSPMMQQAMQLAGGQPSGGQQTPYHIAPPSEIQWLSALRGI